MLALGLSVIVGALDGFGLAMFLPLLQMVDGSGTSDPESLGSLRFLVDGMRDLGIPLTLTSVMLMMLLLFTLKGIAKFIEAWYRVIIQRYFIKKIRFNSIDLLSNYSYKSFVLADVGRIQNTLSGEVGQLITSYKNYTAAAQAVVMVLVYVVLAFLANPEFALFVAIAAVLSNQVYRLLYSKTKDASKKMTKGAHRFQGQLIQQVAFFKYLKATSLMKPFSRKLKETVSYMESLGKKMGFYNAILASTKEPLMLVAVIGVVLIQVTYFSQNLGLIILSLLFFYRSLTFLMTLQTSWNQFLQVSGSLENLTEFMEDLRKDQDKTGSKVLENIQTGLELKNVQFAYTKSPVLRDITLSIARNETIAFVGESGSGKTTLVNILAGLIEPDSGQFLIDGCDSRDLDISSYQKRIGYITQEPVIFSDSIYNNVTFWAERTDENLQRFWNALRSAAIDDFVRSLDAKEDSLLGNNGILVSGGQKQRISIARELFKRIDVLIMDEATSALDSETERMIQQNIDDLKGKYTILIVAHRLATIKNADRIVLLSQGRIENAGSFEELKQSSKAFSKMVELQEV